MDDNDRTTSCLSVITEGEVRYGASRMGRERREEFLEQVDWMLADLAIVVPITSSVAAEYARLRREMELIASPMAANDLWIAATALEAEMTLVSSDGAFAKVPGLKLEDWLEPI